MKYILCFFVMSSFCCLNAAPKVPQLGHIKRESLSGPALLHAAGVKQPVTGITWFPDTGQGSDFERALRKIELFKGIESPTPPSSPRDSNEMEQQKRVRFLVTTRLESLEERIAQISEEIALQLLIQRLSLLS